MKRFIIVVALMMVLAAPALVAQDYNHVEFGAAGDYFRYGVPGTHSNLFGLAGNIFFNVHKNVQIGGDVAYDFQQGFNLSNPTNIPASSIRINTRIVRGMVGPEIKGSGKFRPFVTMKGGFINWNQVSPGTGIVSGFDLGSASHFAIYPGGGIEAFAGPIGVRVEIGDFIYFNNGAKNNLRIGFGPQFRF